MIKLFSFNRQFQSSVSIILPSGDGGPILQLNVHVSINEYVRLLDEHSRPLQSPETLLTDAIAQAPTRIV